MECNKDEAIRAKEIAEKKMENNDFEGARKFAKKAQNLYPGLENITQLLTICDVHCSSQKRVLGSEKDWYEILQVEKLADVLIVRKQYRRLALFLHPDKNQFPGAEAAFKLICEANTVLSDPGNKSLYDNKIRVSVRSTPVNPPTYHKTENSHFNNKYRAQKNTPNGFSSLNPHQAVGSSSSVKQECFWTCCSFCKVKYQYERKYVNRALRCQQCLKAFWAHEISPRGPLGCKGGQPVVHPLSSKASSSQPAGFQEKGIRNQVNFKMDVKNDKGVSASHASLDNVSRKTVQQEPQNQAGSGSGGFQTKCAVKSGKDLKVKETDFSDVRLSHTEKEAETAYGDAITRETGDLKNQGRKRSRKKVIESSENFNTSSEYDKEDQTTRENFGDTATEMDSVSPGVHFMQRSTRKRQNVIYNENGNDFTFPLKGAQARTIPDNNGKGQKDAEDAQDNASNGFSSLNPHQAAGSSSSVKQECFWTCCPFCKVKYQYERKYVNRVLRCQQCLKAFWAHEISSRGPLGCKGGQPVAHPLSSKASSSQPAGFQEKGIQNQVNFKMDVKNDKGVSASHVLLDNVSRKTVQQEPQNQAGSGSGGFQTECAVKSGRDLKVKETDFSDVRSSHAEKEAETAYGDAITRETGDLKNQGGKRGRKKVIESSENFNTLSECDRKDATTRDNFCDTATEMDSVLPGLHFMQRSTRKRQRVIYNENGNDFAIPLKGGQARKIPDGSGKGQKDSLDAEDARDNFSNGFRSLNPHEATGSSSSIKQECFWTCCTFCNINYQSERKFVNSTLICPKCTRPFRALEISPRSVPLGCKGGQPPGVHFIQRSTRKRQHVLYNENGSDFAFPQKGAQAMKLPDDSGKGHKVDLDAKDSIHGNQNGFPTDADNSRSDRKQARTVHPEGNLQCKGADRDEEFKVRRETGARLCIDADVVEIKSDSDKDSHSSDNSDADLCEYPDAEFSDFDKYRDDNRFAVNQIWACYDTLDGMPRFYAKVRKISKSPFELSFTWLEADPKDEAQKKWVARGLPVGCGSFKLGKTEKTARRLSFSHQMYCANGQKRGSFIMYPRKGEIWAILKDWDMNWSSNPENHVFKCEIVEVLSDFVAGAGIKVGYLDKVTGFLSLFQRISPSKIGTILIGPSQLYKFSHRVPCCKMTGTERVGVPKDSFELDPASLPLNPDELYYPSKAKMECGNLDPGVDSSSAYSAKRNGESVVPEGTSGPKEYVDLEGIDGKVSKLRRSPRRINLSWQNGN